MHNMLAFTVALLLMVVTPGPGVIACVSRGLAHGFRYALHTAIGIVTGDIVFLFTAIFGLAAIARILGELFIVVRFVGAAYLIWLGIRTWRAIPEIDEGSSEGKVSGIGAFLSGLSITLGNPKPVFFYLGILPSFIELSDIGTAVVIKTVFIVVVVTMSVLLTYSFLATKLRSFIRDRRMKKRINRFSGGAMIAVGVMMLGRK